MNLHDVVRSNNFVVLDTETTGLDDRAEIIQIAIIEHTGKTLLDTLVKPTCEIPADATRVHHITDAMVADAAAWREVREQVLNIVTNRQVIIYNVSYDTKLLRQTDRAHGQPRIDWLKIASFHCAMLAFAPIFGHRGRYGDYRWQTLGTAAGYYNLPPVTAPLHSALGDCLMTLAVCRAMAARLEQKGSR